MMCKFFDNSSLLNSKIPDDSVYARVIKNYSGPDSFIFCSENKSEGFCIAFKKKSEAVIGLDTAFIIYDQNGVEDFFTESTINDQEVLPVYDILEKAANDGLQSLIEALTNLNVQNRKLSISAQIWVDDIQESVAKQNNQESIKGLT